jgi:hypothetical protein
MVTPPHGAEGQLTITPIIAWRRWVVSQRRPWEEGTGAVLRGAWGRAWTGPRLTARCLRPPIGTETTTFGDYLHNVETGMHPTPPPEPECTCGIYAEKVDATTPTHIPRLEGRPTVGGFVELSGIVIEGTHGYRAREAVIVGPLELHIPCVGATTTVPKMCPKPATVMQSQRGDPVGACEEHVSTAGDGHHISQNHWACTIVAGLAATYTTEIIHPERRATHGHW